MNHGWLKPKRPRAPVRSGDAFSVARTGGPSNRTRREPGHNPFRIGPPRLFDARGWHENAVQRECAGDTLGAIESYYTALAVGGPDAQIAFDLAYALAASGQVGAAIERYRQVIEIDATRADAWVNLGLLQAVNGNVAAGIESLRQAVRLNPTDPDANFNLADLYDEVDEDAATNHWRAYLRLATGSTVHVKYARERLRNLSYVCSATSGTTTL